MRNSVPTWIIPAYAGSTVSSRGGVDSCGDHPRIRGEHQLLDPRRCNAVGSSPHTRGAHQRAPVCALDQGIIPAYAGSTLSVRSRPRCGRDHPRIRGEHDWMVMISKSAKGSSPHTRGARVLPGLIGRRVRIIPAYAGSTLKPDYVDLVRVGSSPHTRGAPSGWQRSEHPPGIIPAYAGSTR